MSSAAAVIGLIVLLLCVQVIQSQNDWGVTYTPTEICALKGSTVEIRCWYRYPITTYWVHRVQETLWFTELNGNVPVDLRTDSQYSGRVEHICSTYICTLRIRDVRESDSAEYKFMFRTNLPDGTFTGSPGVTLSVTDLQVKVERYSSSSRAYLTCVSSCQLPDHPSYIWYKSGQKVPAETSYRYSGDFNSADSFSCAVKGHEAFPSPPVYAPKLPSVSVSPSGEIVEGSSVNLTCSSDANPAANYTWYKENKGSPKASGQIFTITAVRAEHSGNYYCEVWNKLGSHASTLHLTVVSGTQQLSGLMKSIAAGSITAILLVIIFISAFFLIRRKMVSKQTAERPDNRTQLNMGLLRENPSAAVQRRQAEKDDLCYANVSFPKHQEDPIYSNINPARLKRHKKKKGEEEDAVQYTAVNCERASASPEFRSPEDAEDPSALYSKTSKA